MQSRSADPEWRDPVCGMLVESDTFQCEYQNIPFHFCSEQCRRRFCDNPHLYVGLPGHPAPKQEGVEVIKRRRIRLSQPLPDDDVDALVDYLQEMMGIKRVRVERDIVEVSYDLLQVTAEQIEERIARFGAHLGEGWSERLRRAWIHFEEENNLASLEVSTSWGHGEHKH